MADISKVQFFDIQESYGCGEPVTFRCRIVGDLIPNPKDWVGLYRVGWKLPTDYVTYEWISIPSCLDQKSEKEFVCTFKDKLPQNDEDFFQFCYVDSSGSVCGVSSPFQFLEDYDIVVIDETESMLVVDSKPPQLSGGYEKISLNSSFADEVSSKQAKIEELSRDLAETREQMLEKDKKLTDMKLAVDEVSEQLLKSQRTVSELGKKDLAYEEKEKTMNVTIQELQKQLCVKAQELELLKMEHSTTVDILNVKQDTIDNLTGRCDRMFAELIQSKKLCENFSNLQVEWKALEKEYLDKINSLQTTLKSFKHQESDKRKEVTRFVDEITVTDGIEEPREMNNESELLAVAKDDQAITSDFSHRHELSELQFPPETSSHVIREQTESQHKICPLCNVTFPLEMSYEDFETHVYEHLAETLKLPGGLMMCPVCQQNFLDDIIEEHVQSHFAGETMFQYF